MNTPRWHYLVLAVLFFAIAAVLLVLLSGCNGSPTDVQADCAMQSGCVEGAPSPISKDEERTQIESARLEVSQTLGKPITTPDPRVVYVRCPFRVSNSNFGNVCAAGVTRYKDGYIQVMTFDPNRTAPLVRWEARNFFFCTNGACDRAI